MHYKVINNKLIKTYSRNRNQNLHKKPGQRMFNILILDFQKILCALLHKLEGGLKLFDGHHLHSEELHTHEQADDTLRNMWPRLLRPEFFELSHETRAHWHEAGLGQCTDHFGIQVGYYVNVASIWTRLRAKKILCLSNYLFIHYYI